MQPGGAAEVDHACFSTGEGDELTWQVPALLPGLTWAGYRMLDIEEDVPCIPAGVCILH